MVTYRPVKNWLIPLVAIVVGTYIGFSIIPSHQEFDYHEWVKTIDKLENQPYEIETNFHKDQTTIAISKGYWSAKRSKYHVITPMSDVDNFVFDVFLEKQEFFIFSGNEWNKGEYPHRIIDELSPLDNPFQWIETLLKEADEVSKNTQGDKITYKAVFHSFNDLEFQGILLKKQNDTTLTMLIEKGRIRSISFEANPIKPKEVPILNSYPEYFSYRIEFSLLNGDFPNVPKEAFLGKHLD